ncbi:MAG: DJ-1/PfpI family protein [bacterium]|nr:DJ-1/PfpI family protein [bacterium]
MVKEKEAKKMEPIKKKVVMIIASSNFRDEEYLEPRKILESAGCEIKICSSSLKISKGYFGTEAKPEILIDDLKAKEFDAIIFIGGSGAEEYFNSLSAHKVAVEAVEKEKVLSAICVAPSILANAGVLHDRRATSFSSERSNLVKKGAIFTQTDVEIDGRIVTAEGPKSAKKFGEAILELLKE